NSFYPQVLYKTIDGGSSWTSYSFFPQYIYTFQFPTHEVGYSFIGYDTVKLYKTTNTGTNWNFASSVTPDTVNLQYRTLHFINESTGFVFSDQFITSSLRNYNLHKTTNDGLNWYNVYSETVDPFAVTPTFKINFINGSTGFLFLYRGKLLKSTDVGETWFEYKFADRPINDIAFTDDNTGYATGEGGLIMKTTNGGTIDIQNINSTVPSEFVLKQNYPNPFNPNTIISYEIARNGFVSLKVFDILGKEVKTFVNENQNAGNYNVEFNGLNLPSGIYFYKLTVNDFSETKRMVLLK
ncbi:MAG TPA: T9SS type A sorting domain-containing protein, partial [Ignavibacteria bacterium]|nr:T9SS type A sorting domain-containing protein [Ignavibacteria bacterium]HMR42003.1 T9SS type A sorting domain-containing protein [Ignavibacteria bacterium]